MTKIKVCLVEIRDPKNWKLPYVITPSGIVGFKSSDGKQHTIVTSGNNIITTFGKLYQMVGYDSTQSEENKFLPISIEQWRLCTKFIPRDTINNLVIGLSNKGILHNMEWQPASINSGNYELFKRKSV